MGWEIAFSWTAGRFAGSHGFTRLDRPKRAVSSVIGRSRCPFRKKVAVSKLESSELVLGGHFLADERLFGHFYVDWEISVFFVV